MYTGAHKQRFDEQVMTFCLVLLTINDLSTQIPELQGRGRGLSGRDMGNEQKVTDLSQITRPALHAAKPASPSGSSVRIEFDVVVSIVSVLLLNM